MVVDLPPNEFSRLIDQLSENRSCCNRVQNELIKKINDFLGLLTNPIFASVATYAAISHVFDLDLDLEQDKSVAIVATSPQVVIQTIQYVIPKYFLSECTDDILNSLKCRVVKLIVSIEGFGIGYWVGTVFQQDSAAIQ